MSRIASKPITVPTGVEIKISGDEVSVKGPRGTMKRKINPLIKITSDNSVISVLPNDKVSYIRSGSGRRLSESIGGTTRALVSNMVAGVSKGFERKLILVGVGYRAQLKGKTLGLTLGFSHPVEFVIPDGIQIECPSQTEVIIKGIDKQLVGYVAAQIRSYRPPEPYKGKGIRYSDEVVIQKETKKK